MKLYKDPKLKQTYHLLDFKPDDFLALLDLYNEPESSFTDAMERVGLSYVIFFKVANFKFLLSLIPTAVTPHHHFDFNTGQYLIKDL